MIEGVSGIQHLSVSDTGNYIQFCHILKLLPSVKRVSVM